MSVEELAHFSKDQLIDELINRQTFAGVVIYHREDAKDGHLEPGEIVMTKSPPLARDGVEQLLQLGQSLVVGMFGATGAKGPGDVLPLHADSPPLRIDEGGVVRVGNSRISLDLVVEQYENGVIPEDMVRAYDALPLAEVHAAIAYYLRHREQVAAYLKQRGVEAEALRTKIEAKNSRLTRDELIDRRIAREKDHAPTGQ